MRHEKLKIEKKKKLKFHYVNHKENFTVAERAAPGDLGLQSHPKDCQQKLISIWSPIQTPTKLNNA